MQSHLIYAALMFSFVMAMPRISVTPHPLEHSALYSLVDLQDIHDKLVHSFQTRHMHPLEGLNKRQVAGYRY